jgi:hypothetical protein
VERGGSWVVAQTEPGGADRERQLKQHGAARRCEVCKAVKSYQAGELDHEQALARAGWDRASEHERGLLLDMFGLSHPPENMSAQPGSLPDTPTPQPGPADAEVRAVVPAPRPAPAAQHITPEIVALVDQLEHSWTREITPRPDAQTPHAAAELEMEPQA